MPDRTVSIPPNDASIHVLAADPEAGLETSTHLSRLHGDAPSDGLSTALGAAVDPAGVEVFAAKDVAGMGLRAYLADAYDADPAALKADAKALDSLSETVLVVSSKALPGGGTLRPEAGLRPVGAYPVAAADHAPRPLPEAAPEAARPATPGTATGTPAARKGLAWIVLGALLVAMILVLAL